MKKFIKCKNLNNTTVLNFKKIRRKLVYNGVQKDKKKRFIEIGEVVVLHLFYLKTNISRFRWHYDKNTYRLRPVLLKGL